MILSKQDIDRLRSIEKPPETVERESTLLRSGVPPIKLGRRCRSGDGIVALSGKDGPAYAEIFDRAAAEGRAVKFVAASGAASRMFESPLKCLRRGWATQDLLRDRARNGDGDAEACLKLLRNLKKFAFFPALEAHMESKGLHPEILLQEGEYKDILENLLTDRGLGYSGLPKGLIPFHSYPDGAMTAFEEHLVESAGYLKDRDNRVRVHFTVAPDHVQRVRGHLKSAVSRLSSTGALFDVTCSVQARSTDTVVLGRDGRLLRDDDGQLILRPSGHGALLQNLNSIAGDIVFIRTVDNVLPDPLKEEVCFHKKVLGGYLAALQGELFARLRFLSSGDLKEEELIEIKRFAETKLNLSEPPGYDRMTPREKAAALLRRLNAPIRVCGMVRNTGYPGGRPFWVRDEEGWESPQIVEPSQVDIGNEEQGSVWESCEFFNPADIVCGLRDYSGRPFDLSEFSDPALAFISEKTYRGRPCRVLERAGLWNGSMAKWNTVFVEVPALTLRPVKTILDLLEEPDGP